MLPTSLKNQIVGALSTLCDVQRIVLFGSHARGVAREDSDVDILVIINKSGIAGSYSERLNNRTRISRQLMEVRKKVPLDLLVYTQDEWRALTRSGSDFVRNVVEEGVVLA